MHIVAFPSLFFLSDAATEGGCYSIIFEEKVTLQVTGVYLISFLVALPASLELLVYIVILFLFVDFYYCCADGVLYIQVELQRFSYKLQI